MSNVILQNVCKKYDDNFAVQNFSLEIEEGEFLTLLGPSGCGKSTTLNMIAGLEPISSGKLLIGNNEMNNIPTRKRNIGMVFQSYALFPHMTVNQNIAFGLKIKKKSRLEIFEKLDWVKTLLGLEEKGKSFPRELSGGERQRVALGRAIVTEPSVLLLDEPLSNLDQELREKMTTELKRIHREVGCTMVYVTHNQMEAMRMSDRIAIMKNGKLIQCDSPMNIFNNPRNQFVSTFIGSPPMNMFNAKLVRENDDMKVDIGGVKLILDQKRAKGLYQLKDQEIIAGIRPQQVYYFKDRGGRRHSDTELETIVDITEPLGDRIMVEAKFNNVQITFLMLSDVLPASGEKIKVVVDGRNIHLYNKDSRERIIFD